MAYISTSVQTQLVVKSFIIHSEVGHNQFSARGRDIVSVIFLLVTYIQQVLVFFVDTLLLCIFQLLTLYPPHHNLHLHHNQQVVQSTQQQHLLVPPVH